jgi:methylenetetrahydrofolate dehydrogenase (NADP+)/methenyltetrahydrofolate cyclohydrolase
MILEGKALSEQMKIDLSIKARHLPTGSYIAILFFGDNSGSKIYVQRKQAYGEEIGIPVAVFGQYKKAEFPISHTFDDISIYLQQQYDSIFKIRDLINFLNFDKDCVGIIVQLPLPAELKQYESEILSAISPLKDIDGLSGVAEGLSQSGIIDFLPATPKAVLTLLNHYKLDTFKGKTIAILGQSNIVGKPLALACIQRWATVYSCNIDTPQAEIKANCQKADYIIACTGHVHLIDESYIWTNKNQIIVDVWYGHIDGKAAGDVQTDKIADKVFAYSPVPGGVGPLTIASLFDNIFVLQAVKGRLPVLK